MDPLVDSADADALLAAALPVLDDVVAFVGRRHHSSPEDREEFGSYVRLRLLENERAILRQFRGQSSLRTYLSVVVHRLSIDFCRQRWGTWRPSAEARRLGGAALELERLVHRDGYSEDEAIEMVRRSGRSAASVGELRALAARLPRRVRVREVAEETVPEVAQTAEDAVERPAQAAERNSRAAELRQALAEGLKGMAPTDALALKMRYVDGFTVARIAALLGEQAKPLYRRLERLLADLETHLRSRGFSAGEVSELLGAPAFDDAPGSSWPMRQETA